MKVWKEATSLSKLEQFISRFPWVSNDSVPFARLTKELSQCRIALVSTGGVYILGDAPFSIANGDDVDESFRAIPANTDTKHLRIAHEHFNKVYSNQDINVIFPIERLKALAEEAYIAGVAETNYSITGYVPRPEKLFNTGKAIAEALSAEGVDAALLVPV